MFIITHIDEVDNNQAAKIPQPQLAGDLFGSLHISLVSGVLNPSLTAGFSGIYIYRNQSFGRLDYDGAA